MLEIFILALNMLKIDICDLASQIVFGPVFNVPLFYVRKAFLNSATSKQDFIFDELKIFCFRFREIRKIKLYDKMGIMEKKLCTILALFALINTIYSFYLPGLAPVSFCKKGQESSDKCKVRFCLTIFSKVKGGGKIMPPTLSRCLLM